MIRGFAHTALAAVTALLFSGALLIPCVCAAAMGEADEVADEGCCPETVDEQPDEPDGDESTCCCDDGTACTTAPTQANVGDGIGAIVVDDDVEVDGPSFWLTPSMVAALWLIDRIAGLDNSDPLPVASATELRPDGSDLFLEHSTLLL